MCEIEAAGTTAKEYRTMKEAQGAPTFSADDVRFSSRKGEGGKIWGL